MLCNAAQWQCGMNRSDRVGKMKRRFPRRRQRTAFLLLPYAKLSFFLPPTFSFFRERKKNGRLG